MQFCFLFLVMMVLIKETLLQAGKDTCPCVYVCMFCLPQCIVIGLQSTGESRTREVLDENDGHLDRFVSAAE